MPPHETSESTTTEDQIPSAGRNSGKWWVPIVLALTATGAYVADRVWNGFRVRAYAATCREARHARDWKRLSEIATTWSKLAPQQADPWICLAESASQRGEIQQAVDFLGHLPDGDPKTPPALLERSAMLFSELNRPIEGSADCERALRLQPHFAEAHQRLIFFYAFTLQRARMAKQIRSALEHDCDLPETYVYLYARDWLSFGNATQENLKWLRNDPDRELFLVAAAIYGVTTKALDELSELDKENAPRNEVPAHQQHLAKLAERFPANLELLDYYLKQASTDGDEDKVTKLLARAPPEAVEDNRFWRYKGWLHSVRDELTEAESAYRMALEIHPYDFVAQHQLAAVERRLRKFEDVESLESLSREGHALKRAILPLPDVRQVPKDVLIRMATHAAGCGDDLAARKLFQRIESQQP